MSSNKIIDKWNSIKLLIESADLDVHKNASGNLSAGLRVRRSLRALKKDLSDVVKLTIENDKVVKEAKKQEKAAKKK